VHPLKILLPECPCLGEWVGFKRIAPRDWPRRITEQWRRVSEKPTAGFSHVRMTGNSKSIEERQLIAGELVSRILCRVPSTEVNLTRGDHSSRSRLAPRLQRPTRGLLSPTTQLLAPPRRKRFSLSRIALGEPGRLSPPIWPCTTRGFPCRRCCHRRGRLLPHLFTLTKRNKHFDVSQVYLRDATVLLRRRYILCGTFRKRLAIINRRR
jgi:hypothetical protein